MKRRIGLLVMLVWYAVVPWAAGEPSDASRHVAKYGAMPFDTRHLYPNGDLVLSREWLSRPEERIMVLTFDDGPDQRDLKIAELLGQQAIPAAFFYIGHKAQAMPEIVQQILSANHDIGFHSNRHARLSYFSQERLREEFGLGRTMMNRLGVTPIWFRPPYGDFNDQVVQTAQEFGMQTLLWTIDSRDWAGISAATITGNVVRRSHPGAVLLFHSTHAATLQALPEVLKAAEKAHYRFVSLNEWRRVLQVAHCRQRGNACSSQTPETSSGQP